MAMNQFRTEDPAEVITLGGVRFTAETFSLRVQRPVLRHVLCDGTHSVTLLGELPCTLTLSGRIIPDGGAALPAKLQTLLSSGNAYAFSFRGSSFQNMRITELSCNAGQDPYTAALSLTLIGTLRGAAAT